MNHDKQPIRNYLWTFAAGLLFVLPAALLSGCGSGGTVTGGGGSNPPSPSFTFHGRLKSGTTAIAGSSIQMYAAGSTGYGSAATPLLATPALADATGSFSITDISYACPGASSQIYLVASGGMLTSLSSNTANSSLSLMAVLGNCGDISASTNIVVNEVTTAAAVWSLAPFMKAFDHVGSSATNAAGLAHAFATAALLADTSTGSSPSSSLPSTLTVESAKLYSLANVLASCVDTSGGAPCTTLFATVTPPSGTQPTNTADAALLIVKNPGRSISAIFQSAASTPPYTGLTAAPHDWTMSITTQGGGLNRPTTLAIDSQGKPWIANYPGVLTSLSAMGEPLIPAGITGNGLNADYGLAIDSSDNIWLTNRDTSTVTRFSNSGALLSGTSGYSGGGISFPVAATGDSSGKMWIVNNGNASITQLSSEGVPASSTGYTAGGVLAFPAAVALDNNSTPWIANSGGSVTHLSASGALLQHVVCGSAPTGIALDQSGNVWVADYLDSSVVRIAANTGTVTGTTHAAGGIYYPNSLAIDGNGDIWVANYGGGTFSMLAGAAGTSIGSALSPASGYGLDANMTLPYGIALDASGNVWMSSFAGDRVVRFVGLAVPIKTPLLAPPQLP